MNNQEITDKIFIKELVDAVSILADKKEIHTQVQLFTENATSETFAGGTLMLHLKGRKDLEAAFTNFLKNFEVVYHCNGQQLVTLQGDTATGTLYCMITLIGMENGQKMKTTIGAIYQDEYVRVNNRWLIAKRTGDFIWQEKREAGQ